VLAVLLLVSLTLITIDLRGGDDSPVNGPRGVVASAFGQVERAASAVVRPFAGAVEGIGNIGRHEDRIDDLEQENAELREQLRTQPFDQSRADKVDRLLQLAGKGRYRSVPARVVAVGSGQSFASTVTIDVGSEDGIKSDMTVVNQDGLVGRTTRVTDTTSTVVLIRDATSKVGVRVEGEDELGFLTGRGSDPLDLQLLKVGEQLTEGARLVTFGSENGRPFVPGVPVGEVTSVRGSAGSPTVVGEVEPYVSFTSLDVVAVVIENPDDDPRDSVLPPVPSASSTATGTSGSGTSGSGTSGS